MNEKENGKRANSNNNHIPFNRTINILQGALRLFICYLNIAAKCETNETTKKKATKFSISLTVTQMLFCASAMPNDNSNLSSESKRKSENECKRKNNDVTTSTRMLVKGNVRVYACVCVCITAKKIRKKGNKNK